MATMNQFPPDVPKENGRSKDWDEASDEAKAAAGSLREKASDLADRASETVRDGYDRAKDAMAEIDPMESGKAVIRAVERHPLITFGLGALSVGLIAWSAMRPPEPSWRRYEPDFGRMRRLFGDYASEAGHAGEGVLKSADRMLHDYSGKARHQAEYGGRMLADQARSEPLAALIGVGIAVYVLGSLLAPSRGEEELPRRRSSRR